MRKKLLLKKLVYEHPDEIFLAQNSSIPFPEWFEKKKGDLPYVLEIGMGTGDFLVAKAQKEPHHFFLGLEVKPDRIFKAYKKASAQKLCNIAFLRTDVESLARYHLPKTERIIILFPDPWPKKRHSRRRLTSPTHLDLYRSLLAPEGHLFFKTDSMPLFEYSLESLLNKKWKVVKKDGNVLTPNDEQTAYERRWLKKGIKICGLEACPGL